jgi:hypothetical protein
VYRVRYAWLGPGECCRTVISVAGFSRSLADPAAGLGKPVGVSRAAARSGGSHMLRQSSLVMCDPAYGPIWSIPPSTGQLAPVT